MRWWPVALLAVAPLAGCAGERSSGPTVVATPHVRPEGAARCLADWNGGANAATRASAAPPRMPYPLYGGEQRLRPRGAFQAFVGLNAIIGAPGSNLPSARCYVQFRFPHGNDGGPAMVSYPEIDRRRGVYGDPSITVGNDTDVGGRIYLEDRAGRLHPTRRFRKS